MHKNIVNKGWLVVAVFLGVLWVLQVKTGYTKESWQISEWLINYQGGFVRRGLAGEVLLRVMGYELWVVGICMVIYGVWLGWFGWMTRKFKLPGIIVLGAYLAGGPIINDFWVRKDVLSVGVFAGAVYLTRFKDAWRLGLLNGLLIMMLLIHESIGFYGLPVLALLLKKNGRWWAILPVGIAFLSMLYFKGNYQIAEAIWRSWGGTGGLPGAIDGVGWPMKQGLDLAIQTWHNFSGGIWAPMAWVGIIVLIYGVLTEVKTLNKKILGPILVGQLGGIGVLSILGWDYGRWIYLWAVSALCVYMIATEKQKENLWPRAVGKLSGKLDEWVEDRGNVWWKWAPWLIGVPAYSWNWLEYVKTTPLGVVGGIIWRIWGQLGK